MYICIIRIYKEYIYVYVCIYIYVHICVFVVKVNMSVAVCQSMLATRFENMGVRITSSTLTWGLKFTFHFLDVCVNISTHKESMHRCVCMCFHYRYVFIYIYLFVSIYMFLFVWNPAPGLHVYMLFEKSRFTTPLAPERGAGEAFLKSAVRTAGNSAGNKRSAGKSAGRSAVACAAKESGTASSPLPGTPLVPGTVPGSPHSTFQEVLSSTPFWGQRRRKSRSRLKKPSRSAKSVLRNLPCGPPKMLPGTTTPAQDCGFLPACTRQQFLTNSLWCGAQGLGREAWDL